MKVVVKKRESDDFIIIGNMNLNNGGFVTQRFVATLSCHENRTCWEHEISGDDIGTGLGGHEKVTFWEYESSTGSIFS